MSDAYRFRMFGLVLTMSALSGFPVSGQAVGPYGGISAYGMPGMIDMPTATALPDGTLAFSLQAMPGTQRLTLAFQALPRVTVSFRYAAVDTLYWRERTGSVLHDRSFDLHWQVLDEGLYRPALAVGLRDFIGTGIYSGEYVVASRSFTPRLRASLGMGWGRLATHGSFSNPLGVLYDGFRTRPGGHSGGTDLGGQFEVGRFFRGPAAFFGGVEYQASERLTLLAEYSSDAYLEEEARLRHRTPVNVGFRYRLSDSRSVSGYVMHGSTVGIAASFALNPARLSRGGLRAGAPMPVQVRPAPASVAGGTGADGGFSTSWASDREALAPQLRAALGPALEAEGLRLDGLELEARRVVLRLGNRRHEVLPRALGRTARILTHALPPSVEEIVLIPVQGGVAGTAVILRRSDLERHEHDPDGSARIWASARLEDPLGFPGVRALWQPLAEGRQAFEWSIGPFIDTSFFDPDSPLRADIGLRAHLRMNLAENFSVNATVSQRVWGDIEEGEEGPPTLVGTRFTPGVRTRSPLYSSDRATVNRLTLDYTLRPGPDLYARVTLGWLERMYAGVSTELLWSRPDSRLALGAEINHVAQRDPLSTLGVNDLRITTGHVSAYYDLGGGFQGQLDLGRYLAGDLGATLRLERVFASGLRVGAWATLTDMPFSVFGEGSFDKGITVTIPMSAILGQPSRATYATDIRSINRDGGARLNVPGRLYPTIQESRAGALQRGWGAVLQ